MGCIFRFALSVLALLVFLALGWISLAPGASVFWIALMIVIAILVVDLLMIFVRLTAQVLFVGISILTGGCFTVVIEGVFKYFAIWGAAKITGLFVVPWILGPLWWQAILIGSVFAIIVALTTSSTTVSRTTSTTEY